MTECWRMSHGLPRCGESDVMLTIDPVMQKFEYDCGAACVDAVIKFYGIRTCVGVLTLSNHIQGTSPDTIEALLRRAGLKVISGTMTTADLKHMTTTGRPVICPITTPEGGHYVVVRGVGRGKVWYHCPSDGPKSMKISDWEANWNDTSRSGHEYDKWGICPHFA